MKFLLTALNAKYIHSNPAIYSLRAYAKRYREQIGIVEYTINNTTEQVLADLFTQAPDVIGFSCYIWNWDMIQDIIPELHKIMPHVLIWLGGPEVTFDAAEVIQRLPMVTGIMVGEGEATFLELMAYYAESKGSLSQIAGIVTKEGATPARALTDMNALPFLYEDLRTFENKIIYYESSRGCPFRCSYCLSSIDKEVRLRNISIVKQELQFFLDRRVAQVKFVDRTFNCSHEHAMAIWTYIKEHDNGITNFHFEVSADIVKEEEVKLLRSLRPGCIQLEIGVQSTNPKTLQAINRFARLEQVCRVVEAIGEGANIHVHLDLIAGLPYEDYDSFMCSFNDVYALAPEQLQLGFLKVLKGSKMHSKAAEYGIGYTDKPPYEVLYSKWLSYKEILRLKAVEEMVELFYNSRQFTTTIKALEQLFTTPFHLYEALAAFFKEKGYFVNSPSRAYRYEVLLQFALVYDQERTELYKELLTYDMYLREKLKSRPAFARDLKQEKEYVRTFYEKEEKEHSYLPDYQSYQARQMSKMTHLELFYFPVWEAGNQAVYLKSPKGQWALFDYLNRSKLTKQAQVTRIIEPCG